MSVFSIWLGRVVPLVALALHLWGVLSVMFLEGGADGAMFILLAWALMTLYASVAWMRGDYIQHALNMKPWTSRDEFQKEAAAKALSISYIVMAIGLAGLLGLFLNDIALDSNVEIFEPSAISLHLFVWVTFLSFLSYTLPTLIMGWCLNPVPADDE